MNYYIYEITNNINGKTYIGQRKTEKPIEEDKYMGSGTVINRAYEKYGIENFSKNIIEECTADSLDEREIFWIHKRKDEGKAEYNVAGGGQGCSSPFEFKSKEEMDAIKEKMSQTRKGKRSGSYHKTWKLNKNSNPHPELNNAKELLGQKVIIMETEEKFSSYGECADHLGIDNSGVAKCCKGIQKTAGGYHICKLEDYNKDDNPWLGKPRAELSPKAGKKIELSEETKKNIKKFNEEMLGEPVYCITDDKFYPSAAIAAKEFDITRSAISTACRGEHLSLRAKLWRYATPKEAKKIKEEWFGKEINGFIMIMENEKTFKTIDECCKYIDCNKSTIFRNLNGDTKQCKGYHLCYCKDYNRSNNPWFGKERYSTPKMDYSKRKVSTARKVLCLETGKVFNTVAEAGKEIGSAGASISMVCSGVRKSIKGYRFKYIDD